MLTLKKANVVDDRADGLGRVWDGSPSSDLTNFEILDILRNIIFN